MNANFWILIYTDLYMYIYIGKSTHVWVYVYTCLSMYSVHTNITYTTFTHTCICVCVCLHVVRKYPSVHLLNFQKRSWPQMVKWDAWLGEEWSIQVQLWSKPGARISPPSLCHCGQLRGHWSRSGSCVSDMPLVMEVRVERNLTVREKNYKLTI